jgi:hypothetical protein
MSFEKSRQVLHKQSSTQRLIHVRLLDDPRTLTRASRLDLVTVAAADVAGGNHILAWQAYVLLLLLLRRDHSAAIGKVHIAPRPLLGMAAD